MPERIVILGGGFAGSAIARALRRQHLDITVIDQHNYYLFQPLLYQVATGELLAEAIATPQRRMLHGHGLRFRMGQAVAIDLSSRSILLADGDRVEFDVLFIALGTVTNFFGNEAIARHALQIKGIEAAEEARSRIFSALEAASHCRDGEQRRQWLHFVIAGGGAAGVELCGALLELLRDILPREYPELRADEIQVTLVHGDAVLLPGFAVSLQAYAARALRQMGTQLRIRTHVTGYDGQTVQCDPGPPIPARTLFWTAGVTASPLAATLPGVKGRGGRIVVDPYLRLPGHPEVFVLGDIACSDRGAPWPQVAPFALQTARYAAKVLQCRRLDQPFPAPFSYHDPGSMVVLGRFDGVCQIDRLRLRCRGGFAWILWLSLHLYRIIGTRNRLRALLDWSGDYLRRNTAVQLVRDRFWR